MLTEKLIVTNSFVVTVDKVIKLNLTHRTSFFSSSKFHLFPTTTTLRVLCANTRWNYSHDLAHFSHRYTVRRARRSCPAREPVRRNCRKWNFLLAKNRDLHRSTALRQIKEARQSRRRDCDPSLAVRMHMYFEISCIGFFLYGYAVVASRRLSFGAGFSS